MEKRFFLVVALMFLFPVPGYAATPVIGDWDGDGRDNVGVFSGNRFYLDTDGDGAAEYAVSFGRSTDLPVCGDWDGDGDDNIGVFRSDQRRFYLDANNDGTSDITVTIGRSSDMPVVGDWDSDGKDDVGVFRPADRRYFMDSNEDGIHERAVTIGRLGDYSLVGDWDGDGVDSIGIFRPGSRRFYLDDDDDGSHEYAQTFGAQGDLPVIGDWNGDGRDDIGVYRSSTDTFYLDDDFDGGAESNVPAPADDDENVHANYLGMTFNRIPAGTFIMGSPSNELGRYTHETQHQVTLTQDFYMQTTEVTQEQWQAVMGDNPSYFTSCGADCPVEVVSWGDVQDFITALNALTGENYTLPTEAQWEYAARAGSTTALANGNLSVINCADDASLDAIGWYCGNAEETHPVARKQANAWGLYDMHGNVLEYVQDWYHEDLGSGSATDPTGPSSMPTSGALHVARGGAWYFYARLARSAYRYDLWYESHAFRYLGFRLVWHPAD